MTEPLSAKERRVQRRNDLIRLGASWAAAEITVLEEECDALAARLAELEKREADLESREWEAEEIVAVVARLAAEQDARRMLDERINKGRGTYYGDGYMDGLRQNEARIAKLEATLREARHWVEEPTLMLAIDQLLDRYQTDPEAEALYRPLPGDPGMEV